MDISQILAELRAERDRIDQAINALERPTPSTARNRGRGGMRIVARGQSGAPRRRLSPAARKRISDMMKARWAERRRRRAA